MSLQSKITLAERLRSERSSRTRTRRAASRVRKTTGTDDLVGIAGVDVLTLNISGREYTFDVRNELSIIESDADKTLDSHAERMALWSNLAETVRYEIALAEVELEDIRQSRYLAYKSSLRDSARRKQREGGVVEKWTEREITAVIETEPDVLDARRRLLERKQCLGYCVGMVRAFDQRGRMIVKWGKMTPHADDNVES
jgi:hypothetical protein